FVQEIQEGDYAVVPHGPQFYVAEVTGPALYDASKRENDASHRRPVRWLNGKKPIPRALASARLQARMKARHTIAYAGDLVEDIERVLKDAEEGKSPSLSQDIRQGLKEVVRRELLSGRMNPERFEGVVLRLMEGLGATEAWIVPRASDKGADVLAQFTLAGAFDFTVGVQAKYYNRPAPMGREAVDQLARALREGVAQLGLVVTVGEVASEAYEAAREYLEKEGLKIGIMDGEELVDLLVEKGLWEGLD
ncbi:MAG: restriction endonuclease, partial [Thermus sp.]|uniref:restriction endonuclease n=1 Tax=Thermus sp. TaxID=275 RepID=UPI0025FD6C0A